MKRILFALLILPFLGFGQITNGPVISIGDLRTERGASGAYSIGDGRTDFNLSGATALSDFYGLSYSTGTLTISPTLYEASSAGETMNITVTASAGVSWTASESVSWLNITSGSSGTGNGTITVVVDAGSVRDADVTVSWSGTDRICTIEQLF